MDHMQIIGDNFTVEHQGDWKLFRLQLDFEILGCRGAVFRFLKHAYCPICFKYRILAFAY
ncbi:Uncharacterised protein [Mycobacteroides abscessus subsp. abscessus]|nr:Uncharacterised protein [Mycobacteroides abscessus subsp. abscessus]